MARQDEFFTQLQTMAPPPSSSTSFYGDMPAQNASWTQLDARLQTMAPPPSSSMSFYGDMPAQNASWTQLDASQQDPNASHTPPSEEDRILRWLNVINNVFNQGALLGYGDELGSAISATLTMGEGNSWQERYANHKKSLNETHAAYVKDRPVEAMLGQLAGGLFTTRGMGIGAAAKIPAYSKRGAIGQGLIEGTVVGALSGFGTGDERDGRLTGALTDGVLGGALGAAMPAATGVIRDVFENPISRMLRKQNINPHQLANGLKQQGDNAMLLDYPWTEPSLSSVMKYADDQQLDALKQPVLQRQRDMAHEYIEQLNKQASVLHEQALLAPASKNEEVIKSLRNKNMKQVVEKVKDNLKHVSEQDQYFDLSQHQDFFGRLKDTGLVVDKVMQETRDNLPYLKKIDTAQTRQMLQFWEEFNKKTEISHPDLNQVKLWMDEAAALKHKIAKGEQMGLLKSVQEAYEDQVAQGHNSVNVFDKYGLFKNLSPSLEDVAKRSRVGDTLMEKVKTAKDLIAQNQANDWVDELYASIMASSKLESIKALKDIVPSVGAGASAYMKTENPWVGLGTAGGIFALLKAAPKLGNARRNKMIEAFTATGQARDKLLASLPARENDVLEKLYNYSPAVGGAMANASPIKLDLPTIEEMIRAQFRQQDSKAKK